MAGDGPLALPAELAATALEQGARQVVLVAGYGAEQDPATGLELVQLHQPVVRLGSVGLDALLEGPNGAIEAIPGRRWGRRP